jgi:tetratricopeptide (TPR) repeat protein
MMVVLGRLYAKINEREQAEDCLHEAKFAQKPADLSEFYGGVGDLHFDLKSYELAKVSYGEAIDKSRDPQNLKRFHLRLEHIKEIVDRKAKLREQSRYSEEAMRSEQAGFKEQAMECIAQGEGQLADLKSLNKKQDVLKDQLQEAQRRREKVKPKTSMYCSIMLLAYIISASLVVYSLRWNSTKTEDNQEITLETAEAESNEAQFEKQRAREFRTQGEEELANLHEKAASILSQDDASKQLDLANVYFDLGFFYRCEGDNTRAEEYYLKCLTIWQEVLPANHPDLANIYYILGFLYRSKEDKTRAEEYFSLSKLTLS